MRMAVYSKEMRDKFEGGVMGSDGCIYCIPLRLSSTTVSSWPHTMEINGALACAKFELEIVGMILTKAC